MGKQIISESYPGGKNAAGVAQTIINQMPPHAVYVEAFLGGGAILRAKRPAAENIGIEIDEEVCRQWNAAETRAALVIRADAVHWLGKSEIANRPETLVYIDPPYLMESRSSKKPIYRHDFNTWFEHMELIETIRRMRSMIIVSHYAHPLYNGELRDWRRIDFPGQSHSGPRTETIWCNFAEPKELHDYRFLGKNFRKRQDLKRKKDRWCRRLSAMSPVERQMIIEAIAETNLSSLGSSTVTIVNESAALPMKAIEAQGSAKLPRAAESTAAESQDRK